MVKRFFWVAVLNMLFIGACSVHRGDYLQKEDDIAQDKSKQRSEQQFRELDASTAQGSSVYSQSAAPQEKILVRYINRDGSLGKDGAFVEVEIDTTRIYSDSVSLKDAEVQTRNFVRELAIQKALPTEISITSLSTNMYVERNAKFDESVALGIFMMSSSAGRFVKEEFLKREPSFDARSNSLKYRMHYQAQIIPQQKAYNPSMALGVELSETLLKNGEKFKIKLRSNTDGYLYCFNFLSDNSVAMFFPTLSYTNNAVSAGKEWVQDAIALCDPQKEITIETLYFVFSADPISGWENFRSNRSGDDLVFSAGEESFMLFQNWLSRSNPERRLEKLAQIHVYKDK